MANAGLLVRNRIMIVTFSSKRLVEIYEVYAV